MRILIYLKEGATPLHVAVSNDIPDVIDRLMSHGADVNARDNVSAALILITTYHSLHYDNAIFPLLQKISFWLYLSVGLFCFAVIVLMIL